MQTISRALAPTHPLDLPATEIAAGIRARHFSAEAVVAESLRRAKIVNAEGEFQAATRLAEAAEIISTHPQALQLRFLQTLVEVAAENNSTILFPIPIDLLTPFLQGNQPAVTNGGGGTSRG